MEKRFLKMRLPGFSAERSLYSKGGRYRTEITINHTKGNAVLPQAFVPIPSPFKVSWNVYCSEGTCFIVDQFGNRHNITFSNV
jgi:hypothetical protein